MTDIKMWTDKFIAALNRTFPERVLFAGLQGSYSRGEATEDSDIDMVVILDRVGFDDTQRYRRMLADLPDSGRACGFLSCRDDLKNWDVPDLFQLYHDTTPIIGDLGELIPPITDADIDRAIKTAVCGIYHICVHNSIYGRSENTLRGLYKSAVFAVQAMHFRRTGEFVRRQCELPERVGGLDGEIAETYLRLKNGGTAELDALSEKLFRWAQTRLKQDGGT